MTVMTDTPDDPESAGFEEFGREDPSVGRVEAILRESAARTIDVPPRRNGRLVVEHAVWLCACETMDGFASWLIYSVGADGVGWQRLDHRQDVADVVDATHRAGGHPSPRAVLRWLRDDPPDQAPYFADDRESVHLLYAELQRRVRFR
jgi:hypothetical protein